MYPKVSDADVVALGRGVQDGYCDLHHIVGDATAVEGTLRTPRPT